MIRGLHILHRQTSASSHDSETSRLQRQVSCFLQLFYFVMSSKKFHNTTYLELLFRWKFFRNRHFRNSGFECKDNKITWISTCLFVVLSFFIYYLHVYSGKKSTEHTEDTECLELSVYSLKVIVYGLVFRGV